MEGPGFWYPFNGFSSQYLLNALKSAKLGAWLEPQLLPELQYLALSLERPSTTHTHTNHSHQIAPTFERNNAAITCLNKDVQCLAAAQSLLFIQELSLHSHFANRRRLFYLCFFSVFQCFLEGHRLYVPRSLPFRAAGHKA